MAENIEGAKASYIERCFQEFSTKAGGFHLFVACCVPPQHHTYYLLGASVLLSVMLYNDVSPSSPIVQGAGGEVERTCPPRTNVNVLSPIS